MKLNRMSTPTTIIHSNVLFGGETTSSTDKNVELNKVIDPTDANASGGGITLKGSTDKTFNWIDAVDAWVSSEHISLAPGKNITLNGATSGNISIAVPEVAGNYILTLPSVTGTLVTTNGSVSLATNMVGGDANQISYQSASNTTAFITTPSLPSTYLQWTGSAFAWAEVSSTGSPSTVIIQYTESNPSANIAFAIDSWIKSSYRAVKYVIGISQGTTLYQTSEILVLNDGSAGQITEYAVLSNDASKQVTYDADFSGATVTLQASTPTADTSIKFTIQKTVIAV